MLNQSIRSIEELSTQRKVRGLAILLSFQRVAYDEHANKRQLNKKEREHHSEADLALEAPRVKLDLFFDCVPHAACDAASKRIAYAHILNLS